jgi:putative ABC transport system permease protein
MSFHWRAETLLMDTRFALRYFKSNLSMTVAVLVTLALGGGVNIAVFSVANSVLLNPLPYSDSQRLVTLRERNGASDQTGMFVTYGNYVSWVRQARSFDSMGAYSYAGFVLTGVGEPQQLNAYRVNADYWKVLYIPPVLGRYFSIAETTPSTAAVVVLSYEIWQSVFGGDHSVLGRVIHLNDIAYTIIGVASPEYALTPLAPKIWVPLVMSGRNMMDHADHELTVVARLRSGVTFDQAVRDVTRIESSLAQQYPHSSFDGQIVASTLAESVVGPFKSSMLILLAAVALVLAMACVNIANLLLARGAARQAEMAVRSALGADRARLISQLMIETVLLAVAGILLGLGLGAAGIRFFVAIGPQDIPRLHEAGINGPVLTFALGLAFLCALAFGAVPALRISRESVHAQLKSGTRSGGSVLKSRSRSLLAVSQICLAFLLVVAAMLLVRSARELRHVPLGFESKNILTTRTGLPRTSYPNDTAVVAGFERILASIRDVNGVADAALVSRIPITGIGGDCPVQGQGITTRDSSGVTANTRTASAGYFRTMNIPIVRGSSFTAADNFAAAPVAIINASLARSLFGTGDPIGRNISNCARAPDGSIIWRRVVGVSGDTHTNGIKEPVANDVFFPSTQVVNRAMAIVVRTQRNPTVLANQVREAIRVTDPRLVITTMTTMSDVIATTLRAPTFLTWLLTILGLVGLGLALVGVYGIIAYSVTLRTREIGIRLALGASPWSIQGLIVREAAALGAVGVLLGSIMALYWVRVMAHTVYGVAPRDPLSFVTVSILLVLTAVCAAVIPARRASSTAPTTALRF